MTRAADVLQEAVKALGDLTVPDVATEVPIDAALAHHDEAELRFFLYAGLFALLAEAVADGETPEMAGDGAGVTEEQLEGSLRMVRSAEPGVRYARFERRDATERRELMARMRGREIAVTSEWLIPRLDADIHAYRARIAALQDAIARAGDGPR
ncbi:MAG TPA: hypothetical protein VF984_14070 [Actinomycetota bacterium]